MYPSKQITIKKIDKTPPIGTFRRYRFPLDELEVGEFFEVDIPEGELDLPRPKRYRTLCNVRSHVTYYTKTEEGKNKIFACRQSVSEDNANQPVIICIREK